MKDIAVLGCGPAGLLAAHAIERAGHNPVIISKRVQSVMPGAQYIHHEIPGIDVEESQVDFIKIGTKEGYAQKVYGNAQARCSWDLFPVGTRPCWSMKELYGRLWDKYSGIVMDRELGLEDFGDIADSYPLVFSSVPAQLLCHEPETCVFTGQPIWVKVRGTWYEERNYISYNGHPLTPWYRQSLLFGQRTTEYGHEVYNGQKGIKPLWTTCRCHPQLHRIGRFGKWQKGVLVTDAFKEVQRAMQQV